jgi:PEP-CTERM motif
MDALCKALVALPLCLLAADAAAMTTLTWEWSDISCGVIAANGTRTEQPCDGRSFSALSQPGEGVYVQATLNYHYSDDGLLLDPSTRWALILDGFNGMRQVTHEAGALSPSSQMCASRAGCELRPSEYFDSFNGSTQVFGDNDVPDSLSGGITLEATSITFARNGRPTVRTAFISTSSQTISGIAPAIPEPATVALMFAGLAALGLARRNH